MPVPNRRSLIAGTSAALLSRSPGTHATAGDAAEAACLRFVELQDRSSTLFDEYPVLESWLARKYPDFIGKSDEEQARYPEAARFNEIKRELDIVEDEAEKLLPIILKSKSRTPGAIVAKLMAAERLTCGDENPQVKRLLISTIKDLGELFSVETWHWTTPWPNSNGPGTSNYEPS
jgi:hypothetical protein